MSPKIKIFSAKEHGFRFVNRFAFKLPVKFKLPYTGSINLGDVVYGLCGGMCFGALDYFHLGETVPSYTNVDDIDSKLFTYLCDRQLDSLKLGTVLKVIEWMLKEDNDIALRMARYEIPKLRRKIDRGEPVVLALIRVQGVGDPTKNHQVLATGYALEPDTKQMTIQLYDPNHPGMTPSITMNLSKPSQGIEIAQSTGESLRGFFVINYKSQKTVPSPVFEAPALGDGAFEFAVPGEKFTLRWPVDSHRVNQYFGENPEMYRQFGLAGHEGLDLYALTNANIYAAADGEVYKADHPAGNPYGLQVRIRHTWGNKIYKTIYAHLTEVFVSVGQQVSAGELIGLADNTGNSFGSHLHLTLKADGEKVSGYPDGIIDPWPYLVAGQEFQTPRPKTDIDLEPLPEPSGLTVYTTAHVNMRAKASTNSQVRGVLPAGEALSVLGDMDEGRTKVGQQGQWLLVKTASGLAGYVAAWYIQTLEGEFPPGELVVYPVGVLNLRSGPATAFEVLGVLEPTAPLSVLGDADNSRSKVGKQGEWLQVQTNDGQRGFVTAWLVHSTGQVPSPSDLVVYPVSVLNVRARPSIDSNQLTVVSTNDPLTVLGDAGISRALIGEQGGWINVRTPDGYMGYVAAWLVRAEKDTGSPPAPDSETLTVFPTADLNIRAQPSINSPRVGGAFKNQSLSVVETDLDAARAKVGKEDHWMHVSVTEGVRGWAAAWFLAKSQV